jgi:hypothetical protein
VIKSKPATKQPAAKLKPVTKNSTVKAKPKAVPKAKNKTVGKVSKTKK